MKSLTVPSYRLPSALAKWRARKGFFISSTWTYSPRLFPFTLTVAKLHRGEGNPAAAKTWYARQVLTIEGSWMLLFKVIRSMTPPRVWPSTYLSNRSLSDGLVSLWEPMKSLLADAYVGVGIAVHGYCARKPGVDAGEGAGEGVLLNFRHQVLKGAGLVAQGVPVLRRDFDLYVQDAVKVKVRRR